MKKIWLSLIPLLVTTHTYGFIESVKRADFNIDKYMGSWHQVAAIPASFQRDCVGETKAKYEKTGELVSVVNSCKEKNGKIKSSEARARINKNYNDASKLEVTFVKLFGKWLWWFAGDYWVLDIDECYTYSVVGGPERKYLWILSREPEMSFQKLHELNQRIASLNYDTCKVIITQKGALNNVPLCEI